MIPVRAVELTAEHAAVLEIFALISRDIDRFLLASIIVYAVTLVAPVKVAPPRSGPPVLWIPFVLSLLAYLAGVIFWRRLCDGTNRRRSTSKPHAAAGAPAAIHAARCAR